MNIQFQNKIYDTIVIGAGISGISAACHLKKYSPKANFLILEGRDNFGGTWDFFKYPGIRSDSDMHTLGFSFKPWNSRKFIADGPAIMGYLDETIKENNLKDLIKFNMHIESASWNSEDSVWELRINNKKLNKLETIKTKFGSNILEGTYLGLRKNVFDSYRVGGMLFPRICPFIVANSWWLPNDLKTWKNTILV